MIDGLEGLISTASHPAWSNVTVSTGPQLTMDTIRKAFDAIATTPPRPFTILLPPPVYGKNAAARRRRRVRAENGAILELPEGSNPMIYLLTSGKQWR